MQAPYEDAARRAAKTIAAIFTRVSDTGIPWNLEPIAPVVDLLKKTPIFPDVRSHILRAICVLSKV